MSTPNGTLAKVPAGVASRAPVPSRWTERVLTVGSLVSGGCFLVALILIFVGRPPDAAAPLDAGAIGRAMVELRPWGWATAGVLSLIVTPSLGLVVTALEYRFERRVAVLALLVLCILAAGLVLALAR